MKFTRATPLALRLSLMSLAVAPPLMLAPRFPPSEGKTWVAMFLALAALAGGAAALRSSRAAWARARRTMPLMLAINAALALSLLAAPDLPTALTRWGELAMWTTLIPLAAASGGARWLPRLGGAAVLGLAAVTLFTLASSVELGGLASLEGGTFGNRNQLGHFLALGCWPLIAWALTRPRWPMRVVALALLAATAWALLLTRSKGAWFSLPVAATAGVVLVALARWPAPRWGARRRWVVTLLILGLVGGAALTVVFARRHPGLMEHERETLSWEAQGVAVRHRLWTGTLALTREHPWLGVGVGQWPLAFPPYLAGEHFQWELTRPREAHSDWLQLVAETGLPGLAALLALLMSAWCWARSAVGRRHGGKCEIWAWAVTLTLLTLGALAAVDFPLQRAVSAILGALWLGALASQSPRPERPTAVPLPRLAAIALMLAPLLVLPSLFTRWARAEHLGAVRAALEGQSLESPQAVLEHVLLSQQLDASPLEADRLASVALQHESPALALRIVGEACQRDPAWPEHWRLRAVALSALGRSPQALAAAERAAELAPSLGGSWNTLGRVAMAAADLARAESALRRALALDPANATAAQNLARCLTEGDRREEAIAVLETSLAARPDDPLLWQMLGQAHHQLLDHDAAAVALEQALALDPSLIEGWERLITVHLQRNDNTAAELTAREAIERAPGSVVAWDGLAMALGRQWRADEAHAALDEALQLDPTFAPAWRTRGLIFSLEGRGEEARAHFLRAFQLDPDDSQTRRALESSGVQIRNGTAVSD